MGMPTPRTLLRAAVVTAAIFAPVAVAHGETAVFSDSTGITIPDASPATPYPAAITVAGMTGRITDVNVTLQGLTHTYMSDVNVLLRAPSGDGIIVLSSQCGSASVSAINLTFDDSGAATAPCAAGTYRPNGSGAGVPAPGGAGNMSTLARFRGQDPNGAWQLYVADPGGGDSGSIAGWSLQITTDTAETIRFPAVGTSGAASRYPIVVPVPAAPAGEVISGVTVTLTGLEHSTPTDLDVLLEGPGGRAVPIMSDVCGTGDLAGVDLLFSDAASGPLGGGPCSAGTFQPTDATPGDIWPAPAPAPTATSLSAFDRMDPKVPWKLYANDDTALGTGAIANASVTVTTTPARPLFFFSEMLTAPEGTTATLRLARLGTPSGPATVDYTSEAGTAEAGSDFTPVSGTVTFARNELTKRIQVPITADGTAEGEEYLTLRLSNATDDAVIDGSETARILIPPSEGPAAPAPATPAPSTPAPPAPAAPCSALKGAAKAGCLRTRKAAAARSACLKRHPKAGARRAACLRAAARVALPPKQR